jgi:glycosyltransferase involved in cell wall biosynthesis
LKEDQNSSSKQLHILLLTSWFPNEKEPYLGNFIEQFALALSKRHQVTLLYNDFSTAKKYGMVDYHYNENLTVCRAFIPARKGIFYKYVAHKMGVDWVKKHFPRVDLIHACVAARDSWHFLRAQKELSRPMIYTEHGSYMLEKQFSKLSYFKKKRIKKLLEMSYERTAVSERLAESMEKLTNRNVSVIGNFVPTDWFQQGVISTPDDTYNFLHISTLDDNKNFQGILDACLILKEKGILNWHFTVVSEENFVQFNSWCVNNDLSNQFTFESHVPYDKLPEKYLVNDCFVLNSHAETFSIVNAEALCFGLHFITTPVGFLSNDKSKYIDKTTINSPDDLALKMELAIKEKKYSGIKGRVFAEQFKEDTILDQYEKLYRKVLG